MIQSAVASLVRYAFEASLLDEADRIYAINRLLEVLALDGFDAAAEPIPEAGLEDILRITLEYARGRGLLGEGTAAADLFDTRIMGCLTPPPGAVIDAFRKKYASSPREATDWFYAFSQNTDYIRRYRIARDVRWNVESEYGDIELSINLAKPEKDPRDIAAAAAASGSGRYPKCHLCLESEGYAGRPGYPARQNHRIIPIEIAGQRWGFQYSPYVYYDEHCIAMNSRHLPMHIDEAAFRGLFDFLKLFPHYFVGSNADLPIVGGSILSHDHFQGGRHTFAMARAPVERPFRVGGFDHIDCGIVKWPLSVLRLRGDDPEAMIRLATHILGKWRKYTDPDAFVFAETDGVPHNTITPIARMNGGRFELDLALRNNLTTPEHPLGLYHPHAELHHIKSENIGLIEVMGLAILPARLKAELEEVARRAISAESLDDSPLTAKHAEWAKRILAGTDMSDAEAVRKTVYEEVGKVFVRVLECCGVFKRDAAGRKAFDRFVAML